jgi:hypothetical protein
MSKIKYDLTDSDPDAALEGAFEDPKPGVYQCKVVEMNPGYSKDDNGKPDKSRPRVEAVLEVQDPKYKGARLWTYLTFGKGFPAQKLDQFLQAFGIASKSKRKGEFDTDAIVDQFCKVRVRAGKRQDGSYRAEVGAVFADDGASNIPDPDVDLDDIFDDEGTESGEDVDDIFSEDAEGEEWEADPDHIYTMDEIIDLELPQIRELCALYDDSTAYRSKDKAIAAFVAAQSAWCESEGVEDPNAEPDEGEPIEDDDEVSFDDDDDAGEEYTRDQLAAMTVVDLKAAAQEVGYTIVKGSKKSDVVEGILLAQKEAADTPF